MEGVVGNRVRPNTGPIRVLHVDDDPEFRKLTADFLEQQADSMAVTSEPGPDDAVTHLDEGTVDCVVSDYDMPGDNGIEFLRTVRESDPDLPFILLTGKGSEEVASEAISAGATDYLQKGGPDKFEILVNRIENAVERARAEARRDRLIEAIETTREGISILDEDGHFVYVNEAYADLYGRNPDAMIGAHWELVYPDDEIGTAQEEILPAVDRTGSWHGRTTGVRADGSTFLEDHVVSASENGGLVCTVRDLSEQEQSRRQLRWYRTVVETLTDPVYVLDETGRFEYVNDAFLELVGYDSDEVVGATPSLIKDDAAVATAEAHLGEILSSDGPDQIRFEVDIRPADSDPIRCEDHMTVLPYDGERFEGSVGTLRDISDRTRQQRALERENDRLEEFARVVAHDLRNPLHVAESRLELARETRDSSHLSEAAAALERSQALVDDLLTLAREGNVIGERESVSLADTARTAWAALETGDGTLAVETDRPVSADSDRLRQVFENLFGNCVRHGGDHVTVTVGDYDGGFYVADDGPGIPLDGRDEVFEPGYSTDDDGTGFGLSIVERIAEAHGWTVAVDESDAGGTRVEVTGVDLR